MRKKQRKRTVIGAVPGSTATRKAIRKAETVAEQMAIFLASPFYSPQEKTQMINYARRQAQGLPPQEPPGGTP